MPAPASPILDPDADFEAHYRAGSDPDGQCRRLSVAPLLLWGRPVEGVGPFRLTVQRSYDYTLLLQDDGTGRDFTLASDGIVPTWDTPGWARRLSPEVRMAVRDPGRFYRLACTLGAYLVFPRNGGGQVGHTINQARGTTLRIADRFDLTLECIRRHYQDPDADNPLGERLAVYGDFFDLFGDFAGYVRFFLLEDLLAEGGKAVRSLMTGEPLRELPPSGLPATVDDYDRYRQLAAAFVAGRNERIRQLKLRVPAELLTPPCSICSAGPAAPGH